MRILKYLSLLLLSSAVACAAAPQEKKTAPQIKEVSPEVCEALLFHGERYVSDYYAKTPEEFGDVKDYHFRIEKEFCTETMGILIISVHVVIPIPKDVEAEVKKHTDKKYVFGQFLIELRIIPDFEKKVIFVDHGSMHPVDMGFTD